MLKKIRFDKDYRCFKKDDTFHFKQGINLLVGDQGTGKSSLLEVITKNGKNFPVAIEATPIKLFAFDFEKDNFRTKAFIDNNNPMFQVLVKKKSHGETVKAVLQNIVGVTNSLIIMDEPDMALSIRSIYALIDTFKEITDKGNQVVISAHNPLFILSYPDVLSLEEKKWVDSHTFFLSHTKGLTHAT